MMPESSMIDDDVCSIVFHQEAWQRRMDPDRLLVSIGSARSYHSDPIDRSPHQICVVYVVIIVTVMMIFRIWAVPDATSEIKRHECLLRTTECAYGDSRSAPGR
jgi:hypothetical protein